MKCPRCGGSGQMTSGGDDYTSTCSTCNGKRRLPGRKITLTKGFAIATTEVSQDLWEKVMHTTPWSGEKYVGTIGECAANYITWNDAQAFLKKLNALDPGKGYRLPTEAEWEYACRAGSEEARYGDLDDIAWWTENADDAGQKYPHAVGGKQANAWGLYDMIGNVWEWCQDVYDSDSLRKGNAVDPKGTAAKKDSSRVLRGGSWLNHAERCSASDRDYSYPYSRYGSYGFRVVYSGARTK